MMPLMKASKGFHQQYQMHEIDCQKKFINNLIDQWRMRLEKVIEEGVGRIEYLIWQLVILRTFLVIDMLFIYRKFNVIKWL